MNTLAALAHALHGRLEPFLSKMIPDFEKNINETTSYDLILDTLMVFRRIFRGKGSSKTHGQHIQQNYKKILELISKAIHHEYSKVVSEALRAAGSFVYILKDTSGNHIGS